MQTDEEFSKSTELEERLKKEGYQVAYIQRQYLNVYYNCWQWFERDSLTPDSSMMKSYFNEIKAVQNKYQIAADKTYLIGFSSGAGMALNMAVCSENLIGGVAIQAGVGFGRATNGLDGLEFMKHPMAARFQKIHGPCRPENYKGHLMIVHGENDAVVHPDHASLIMKDIGAKPIKSKSCAAWLADAHLTEWEKYPSQKLYQVMVPKLGHEWGGGNPAYKYTKKDAPSTTNAIISFLSKL